MLMQVIINILISSVFFNRDRPKSIVLNYTTFIIKKKKKTISFVLIISPTDLNICLWVSEISFSNKKLRNPNVLLEKTRTALTQRVDLVYAIFQKK